MGLVYTQIGALWPWVVLSLEIAVALTASAHAVLNKEETRAAIAWVGLILLAPFVGALLYVLFGINRIQRRARTLRRHRSQRGRMPRGAQGPDSVLHETLGEDGLHLRSLITLNNKLTQQPLLHGNKVSPLQNGDAAFPAMLDAIRRAHRSISLSTYIFDNDRVGLLFLHELKNAVDRGVDVRVIVDDVGARYTWPSMASQLRRAGIRCVNFNPSLIPWTLHYANLRTHRKLLVVDGRMAFTGGMNIREGHCLPLQTRHPIQDLHFRVTGPVVAQLQEIFAEDWHFCTGEELEGDPWFVDNEPDGPVLARGIAAGPDTTHETIHMALLGAIAGAERSLLIATPYFLPEASLTTALNVAALRGIRVDIFLPEKNNLPVVQWASRAGLARFIEHGCHVWYTPPPFDHSKIFVVDGIASFVGSSNWDTRSLRLNFEFNLECYDRELAAELTALVQEKRLHAHHVTLQELNARSLLERFRDGIARLGTPYL